MNTERCTAAWPTASPAGSSQSSTAASFLFNNAPCPTMPALPCSVLLCPAKRNTQLLYLAAPAVAWVQSGRCSLTGTLLASVNLSDENFKVLHVTLICFRILLFLFCIDSIFSFLIPRRAERVEFLSLPAPDAIISLRQLT